MNIGSIINKRVEEFLKVIKSISDLGQHHNFNRRPGGFPIFIEGKSTYYEQNYYEERIENAIWKYLVNGILKDLFSSQYCEEKGIQILWPHMHPQLTFSYVEEIEKRYPIEFIIELDGKRVAYRYTDWCYWGDKQTEFFKEKSIDEMIVLDFSSAEFSPLLFPTMPTDKNHVVTLESFFETYFSKEVFIDYIRITKDAVAEAYNYIGLQTITNLSSQNLPYFIESVIDEIRNTDFCNQQYQVMGSLKRWQKQKYENPDNVITTDDYLEINRRFYNNERFRAMCGASDFAHSLITSEYLYQTMKDNNQFDFTAIVCGYLKSIEQLLYKMVLFSLHHHSDELWIKSRKYDKRNPQNFINNYKGRKPTHVKFDPNLKEYFDITFGSLVNLLDDDESNWGVSSGAKNKITSCLSIYCDECRNEHFHKDNISTIDEVEIIRKNTFLLFYYVLGGYRLIDSVAEDNKELEIVDRSFEALYEKVMSFGGGNYYVLKFPDKLEKLVALPIGQENPSYDINGSLKNASIRFVLVNRSLEDDWHTDNWGQIEIEMADDKIIYVTPDNLPDEIIYVDKLTNIKTVVYKK